MGIKEYFEKQSENRDLKLQDMNLEIDNREKKGIVFDPEEEVDSGTWEALLGNLEMHRKSLGAKLIFLDEASSLKILFPNRVDELRLDEEALEFCKETARRRTTEMRDNKTDFGSWYSYLGDMGNFKICFPDENMEVKAPPETVIEDSKKKERGIKTFAGFAAHFKIVLPERVRDLGLNEELWDEMKDHLERDRRIYWYEFARLAAYMKILFPGRAKELNVNVEAWEGMKRVLNGDFKKRKHWIVYLDLACSMKILAAKEVKIDDKGMELVMEEERDLRLKEKKRPERRKF